MNLIRDIDCFLLDLDGTVYIGNTAIDGAVEAVKRMQKDKRVIFLTNNSSKPKAHYIDRLAKLGFVADEGNVCTSANIAAAYIRDEKSLRPYIVASPKVTDEFISAGIEAAEFDNANSVLLTFDKTLTYEKLARACKLIAGGAKYIATHPDLTCPDEGGDLPDIGSFIALIEAATGRRPDVICGKPYSITAKYVSRLTGIPKDRIAMVGDRLYTDMKFAVDNGLRSVLVLTGETDKELYDKCGFKVDKILDSLAVWDV